MKVLVIVGTRPEAIKLAPVIRELQGIEHMDVLVVLSGQHRDLLAQGLADFNITAQYNLDLMQDGQSVNDTAARVLSGLAPVFLQEQPDWVIVQGDTTTAMSGALAAFHHGIPVCHIEAGLRTGSLEEPWPEEMNRRLIAQLASFHCAPTESARHNLEREGVPAENIFVCGNTVIDALQLALKSEASLTAEQMEIAEHSPDVPLVLCTFHRRENLTAERLLHVEEALIALVDSVGCSVVLPLHPNPALRDMAQRLRAVHPRLRVVAPMHYVPFVHLMRQATVILTDSGGIQEEAAFLGKPVLILRKQTERPEVLSAGAMLVGTDRTKIVDTVAQVIKNACCSSRTIGEFTALGQGGAAALIARALATREAKHQEAAQ